MPNSVIDEMVIKLGVDTKSARDELKRFLDELSHQLDQAQKQTQDQAGKGASDMARRSAEDIRRAFLEVEQMLRRISDEAGSAAGKISAMQKKQGGAQGEGLPADFFRRVSGALDRAAKSLNGLAEKQGRQDPNKKQFTAEAFQKNVQALTGALKGGSSVMSSLTGLLKGPMGVLMGLSGLAGLAGKTASAQANFSVERKNEAYANRLTAKELQGLRYFETETGIAQGGDGGLFEKVADVRKMAMNDRYFGENAGRYSLAGLNVQALRDRAKTGGAADVAALLISEMGRVIRNKSADPFHYENLRASFGLTDQQEKYFAGAKEADVRAALSASMEKAAHVTDKLGEASERVVKAEQQLSEELQKTKSALGSLFMPIYEKFLSGTASALRGVRGEPTIDDEVNARWLQEAPYASAWGVNEEERKKELREQILKERGQKPDQKTPPVPQKPGAPKEKEKQPPAPPKASPAPPAGGAFQKALSATLKWEGGLSNHPADLGGKTNRGIIAPDLTQAIADGTVPKGTTLEGLTAEQTAAIYKKQYWDRFGIGEFAKHAPGAALSIFDTFVQFGSAPMRLQKALRSLGAKISADGKYGPKTKAALLEAVKNSPEKLIAAISAERQAYRDERIEQNPTQSVFRKGWLNRDKDIEKMSLALQKELSQQPPAQSEVLANGMTLTRQELPSGGLKETLSGRAPFDPMERFRDYRMHARRLARRGDEAMSRAYDLAAQMMGKADTDALKRGAKGVSELLPAQDFLQAAQDLLAYEQSRKEQRAQSLNMGGVTINNTVNVQPGTPDETRQAVQDGVAGGGRELAEELSQELLGRETDAFSSD